MPCTAGMSDFQSWCLKVFVLCFQSAANVVGPGTRHVDPSADQQIKYRLVHLQGFADIIPALVCVFYWQTVFGCAEGSFRCTTIWWLYPRR